MQYRSLSPDPTKDIQFPQSSGIRTIRKPISSKFYPRKQNIQYQSQKPTKDLNYLRKCIERSLNRGHKDSYDQKDFFVTDLPKLDNYTNIPTVQTPSPVYKSLSVLKHFNDQFENPGLRYLKFKAPKRSFTRIPNRNRSVSPKSPISMKSCRNLMPLRRRLIGNDISLKVAKAPLQSTQKIKTHKKPQINIRTKLSPEPERYIPSDDDEENIRIKPIGVN